MGIVRKSALRVDSGRKIPCHTGDQNLRQRHAGSMLYQLSYIPIHLALDSLTMRKRPFTIFVVRVVAQWLRGLGNLHWPKIWDLPKVPPHGQRGIKIFTGYPKAKVHTG